LRPGDPPRRPHGHDETARLIKPRDIQHIRRHRDSRQERWIYVVTATAALYLNVFVGIVQAFGKLPPLQALAPTQSEAPFIAAQLVALVAVVAIGWWAVRRFKPAPAAGS